MKDKKCKCDLSDRYFDKKGSKCIRCGKVYLDTSNNYSSKIGFKIRD